MFISRPGRHLTKCPDSSKHISSLPGRPLIWPECFARLGHMALFLPSPPSHQSRMTDSNLVPCLKEVAGPGPIPSSIKKPSPQLAVGTEDILVWHAESRPSPRRAGSEWHGESLPYHQPYCPNAVGKDWVQEPLKPMTSLFFQWALEQAQRETSSLSPSPRAASPSTALP